jgi:hypothetical protein
LRACYYDRVPSAWLEEGSPRDHVCDELATALVLATPPVACVTPARVFDAFGWCASDRLEWRRPAGRWDDATRLDGSDPSRMVFVFHTVPVMGAAGHQQGRFLPRELARLHATGLGLKDEDALAPWGIDAATDGFFEHRVRPRDVLWLAADNLNALFWGLHDWAHFHNHGPFEERAWTELQCDAAALAWLWLNRAKVRLAESAWERVRTEVVALTEQRFAGEGASVAGRSAVRTLEADRVRALAADGTNVAKVATAAAD